MQWSDLEKKVQIAHHKKQHWNFKYQIEDPIILNVSWILWMLRHDKVLIKQLTLATFSGII